MYEPHRCPANDEMCRILFPDRTFSNAMKLGSFSFCLILLSLLQRVMLVPEIHKRVVSC